jgi:hypothetical protein
VGGSWEMLSSIPARCTCNSLLSSCGNNSIAQAFYVSLGLVPRLIRAFHCTLYATQVKLCSHDSNQTIGL